MANRFSLSLLALPMLLSCAAVETDAGRNSRIAYQDRTGQRIQLFQLFDQRRQWISTGGRELLRVPPPPTEFSGPINACPDPAYYCFVTGLHVAIPRTGSAPSWSAAGMECNVLDELSLLPDRPVRIRCERSARLAVLFTYSRRRGIISFFRICPNCWEEEFRVIGETGLFASPS